MSKISPHQIDTSKKGKYYKKTYRMNTVGKNGLTTTVTIPREVLKRKAEEKGLTLEEFLKNYGVVALYDNFDGVFYTFEELEQKKSEKLD